ncbi:CBS domain-containing protein [Streptosporangium album]|uniref:CBS domain-containing protein n=1 Tax=Streptosporangium album TaxID=47479 RepID=A0A7W7S339_9ACTN|nr:CBS domain-containing protein [Streptosporangium album]MBB4943038.1 CBS domain-containing protein [Streptosporangium album]
MTLQVNDVMGAVAIAVHREATFAELAETMRRFKVGAVAVIDTDGRPIGVVSEDDLLLKEIGDSPCGSTVDGRGERQEHDGAAGMTAGEVMTSPALTVTRQTSVPEAARLMHANRIMQLPVVDATSGKIAGTLHQVDLLKILTRRAPDILADVAAAIARLRLDARTLTVTVDAGVVHVGGRLANRSQIAQLVEAGRQVEGVVALEVDALYDHDDLAETSASRI